MSRNNLRQFLQQPASLLILFAVATQLAFATYQALLNNFVIEQAQFTGAEIGILQSLREVPGFLAFTAVFVLLVLKEQTFAIISLAVLGIGVAIVGLFPSAIGLYCTTVLMSIGFHYIETLQTSLSLQWLSKAEAPIIMGKIIAAGSFAGILVYAFIGLTTYFYQLSLVWVYIFAGGSSVLFALLAWVLFPFFPQGHSQHKHLVLRRRYSLYYMLTFLGGARRQIFTVFAAFLLVEKFNFSVTEIAALYMLNNVLNLYLAPKVGKWIAKVGERRALTFEYIGLFLIFVSYAFVDSATVAAFLYLLNHLFFSMAIAIKTYFQKIADPKDIASSAGVSFTINHIAAVFIPAVFGIIWLSSPQWVFLIGAAIALLSLLCAQLVPQKPSPERVYQALLKPQASG